MRGCYPQGLRRALDKLPETLDATYERALLGIEKTKREYAYRLFQCLVVSIRPLRVEELAEVLAVLLDTGEDPEYHVDWRPEDAQQSVLSTCSSLITIANVDGSSVVQFSHFSVKEFLMSSRLANAGGHLSPYHILTHSAHSIIARASLGVLLSLGDQVDKTIVEKRPLALYASQYWVDHAKFEGVSPTIHDLMERLFDPDKPHFATWIWLYDMDRPWGGHMMVGPGPRQPKATPLYYASLCGLCDLVKCLATTHPWDVNASGGVYDTALHAACVQREINTARALLEHGANIHIIDERGRSPLHSASRRGHADVVELLLQYGADVDIEEAETLWTPLHFAAQNGELEICRLLLEYGATIDKTTNQQETPLHVTSRSGNLEIARFLIEQGADITSRHNRGWTPLHMASRHGHLDLVEIFLEGDVDINSHEGTPLNLASASGNLEVARFLIEHGAEVNCSDKRGWTPIHSAARNGHLENVQLLLNHGTDVQVRNRDQETPLILASQGGHVDVSRLLIGHQADIHTVSNSGWEPLHFASRYGHAGIVQLLLDHGADVNVWTADLWAPLHLASTNGHLDVAALLLKHDAEVDIHSRNQKTPLHLVSEIGAVEMASLLIKHGSNVDAQDSWGWTPSHVVAQMGNLDMMKLLLDSGADVGIRDKNDRSAFDVALGYGKRNIENFLANHDRKLSTTQLENAVRSTSLEAESQNSLPAIEVAELQQPRCNADEEEANDGEDTSLHRALETGLFSVVHWRRLLDRGADVKERDEMFLTPLDVAAQDGKLEIAKILIEYCADVNCRDLIGWSPLHKAARNGHVDVVRLLLDNGADVNALQRNHQTPLHIASLNGCLEVVLLLLERGANVKLQNAYGRTPCQEASKGGHRNIAQLLSE